MISFNWRNVFVEERGLDVHMIQAGLINSCWEVHYLVEAKLDKRLARLKVIKLCSVNVKVSKNNSGRMLISVQD
jgi:hypothetical protein